MTLKIWRVMAILAIYVCTGTRSSPYLGKSELTKCETNSWIKPSHSLCTWQEI